MVALFLRRFLGLFILSATVLAGPASAAVQVRVEARPAADPIQAFVRVTDSGGVPVTGLTSADFTIAVDGVNVPLQASDLTLPPSEDPNQRVSVVFVMDYTSSVTTEFLVPMQTAVIDFINAMNVGDFAAVVKFNNTTGANVVAAFTEIDGVGGANNQALEDAVLADYPGDGSNILDAINVGVEQFAAATLPAGPKAVIVVTDGIDSHSTTTADDVIESANDSSIPIFSIGIGEPDQEALDLMGLLATDTGGQFIPAPTEQEIADAYASVSALLTSEYLITIPNASLPAPITDCAEHDLGVTVTGQTTVTEEFTRRTCNTTPDAFTFTPATNVDVGEPVTSNIVTITGIEAPAHISVIQGTYSIGCTATFTNDPGTIADGETVCLRQTSANLPSTSRTTTLTIGGFAATFTTTTRADSGGGGGGGGGGATGLLELLLAMGALFMVRRRTA